MEAGMLVRALVILTGGGLLAGCFPLCEETGRYESRTLSVREDDAVHAVAIDSCFANDFSCERLCVDLLGPPPDRTIRSIVECYVVRDGTGGLTVQARSHLVQKCDDEDDWDWGWYPDAYRDVDASYVIDAQLQPDATPPDAEPADAGP